MVTIQGRRGANNDPTKNYYYYSCDDFVLVRIKITYGLWPTINWINYYYCTLIKLRGVIICAMFV